MTTHAPGQPADHALDALLVDYVAGALSTPLHVLVAGHLALSAGSRAFVQGLEAARGRALEATTPAPLRDREGRLAAVFASDEVAVPAAAPPDPVFPAPLRSYLGMGSADIPWRPLAPGMRQFRVERRGRGEAMLYSIDPGCAMPAHAHEGAEVTLVLKGGFTDVSGHYRRGDLALADQDLDHRPVADPDEDCLCFVVTDAPLRLLAPSDRRE